LPSDKEEEEIRRLIVELRVLEATEEALHSRIGWVNAAITELTLSKMTLEGIQKEPPDASLFVPVGGGSYVKAKLENPDLVIVGMGAGVAVEKTLKEAKEILEERLKDLEKTKTALQSQLAEVAERIREDRIKLQELSEKINLRGALSDVRKAKSGT